MAAPVSVSTPLSYEEKLFEAIRNGEAEDQYVIAPFAVIEEIHKLKRMGEYKRLQEGKLPGALRLDAGGTGYERWQWSCSSGRYGNGVVRTVDFTDGYHGLDFRNAGSLSGRACFCEIVATEGEKSAKTRVAWAAPSAS